MLSYVCWQASVATHCMLVATAGKPLAQLSKYIKYYHIVSWVLPVIISIILYCLQFVDIPGVPQGTPVFGNATFFCWISNSYATYRLVFFYVPLWTTFVYCVFVYGYIWRSFVRSRNKFSPAGTTSGSSSENTGTGGSNAQRAQLQRGHERFIKKAACYMIAFVIAWTPATINRIQNIIAPQVKKQRRVLSQKT